MKVELLYYAICGDLPDGQVCVLFSDNLRELVGLPEKHSYGIVKKSAEMASS